MTIGPYKVRYFRDTGRPRFRVLFGPEEVDHRVA